MLVVSDVTVFVVSDVTVFVVSDVTMLVVSDVTMLVVSDVTMFVVVMSPCWLSCLASWSDNLPNLQHILTTRSCDRIQASHVIIQCDLVPL